MSYYLLTICLFFIGCLGLSPKEKQNPIKPTDKTTIAHINFAYSYYHKEIAEYKDGLEKYQPITTNMVSLLDSFVFYKDGPFFRYDHTLTKTGLVYKDTTRFIRYVSNSRDSLRYMPNKILDFELQGIYMNSEIEDGDDVDRFGFYLNPKTNDVLQIMHWFYVGNPYCIYVYTHNNINPFKGQERLMKEILRLDKPFENTNHVQMNFHITNNKIDSVNITEH